MLELSGSLQSALGSSISLSLGICFLGGILASLSPCIYPLLPVVTSYVGSRSVGETTRFKAFGLSFFYVLGMALVYSGLGMVAALTGSFFGQISTSPLALLVVANIIILFGLNILEVIPLPMLAMGSGQAGRKKGLAGALVLGAASGLVASPCTAPVLGVLLTYVATQQNVVTGGLFLFVFSLGLGLILILAGTFSGLLLSLPKPGNWMNLVKKGLGLAMIGLGEYFLIQAGQLMF
ncbi:MAG: sulfite exporter TauE/SafE family protein [Desulfohalobiaceae bacterium]|nr:sulfite exporter TauE/SafE family protein [Desulfohalobiaceae bacterium]